MSTHPTSLSHQGSAATIAIVEDDAALRSALARLLNAYGYRTESYPDSECLLERENLHEIGCLILDVDLPGMSGLELQAHLRRHGKRLPIVFLSAVCELGVRKRAVLGGCIAFLEKPAQGHLLLAAIKAAL